MCCVWFARLSAGDPPESERLLLHTFGGHPNPRAFLLQNDHFGTLLGQSPVEAFFGALWSCVCACVCAYVLLVHPNGIGAEVAGRQILPGRTAASSGPGGLGGGDPPSAAVLNITVMACVLL